MLGSITLYTSGSTKEPKLVHHDKDILKKHIERSVKVIGLTPKDIVLDVYPANVIAHYTVTAMPALYAGAHLISCNFDPYEYIRLFKEFRPTYISLIPKHIEILEKTKGWENLNMECVRYMVTGSQMVTQSLIDSLRNKGVQLVANWYGMTEMPPPVLLGLNTVSFDFNTTYGYDVDFTDEGECVINGYHTNDIFDLNTKQFLKRKKIADGSTWKTNI